MSGIASLILFVLGVTLSEAFLIAAFVCLLVASFTAWYRNHPDLIIELRNVVLDTNYGGMLHLSNTRPEDNSIKKYKLIVEGYGRTQEGEIVDAEGLYEPETRETCVDLNWLRRVPLKQGVPVEGCVRFLLNAEPAVKGHRFTLIVTDAYNFSRKLKGTLPLDYERGLRRVGDPSTTLTDASGYPL